MDCVTTIIYDNAPLFMSSTGLVGLASSSVLTSTLGKQFVGVAAGGKLAGAGRNKINVYTDPEQLYRIQSDDDTLGSATSYVHRNFGLLTPDAGNSTTVRSIAELDGSSGTSVTTISTQARILKVVSANTPIDGDLTSWGKFVVKINPKFHIAVNNSGV
jgi:hypothetical protein